MSHSHDSTPHGRAFAIGIGLNVAFVVVELGYGIASGSLALLSDAGHNAGDVLGLVLAWAAIYLASRKASKRRTYGFGRASILAALANAASLLIATGAIIVEAISRFREPAPVQGATLIVVASIGIAINAGAALLFRAGSKTDLNMRGAFLHLAADALVSLAVVIAGIVIKFTGWWWLDPATGLLVSVVICFTTWSLLRDSLNLAMDAVPADIDPDEVRALLARQPSVIDVSHLHIWAMSTTKTALTVALRTDIAPDDAFYARLREALETAFHIEHATFEVVQGPRPKAVTSGESC